MTRREEAVLRVDGARKLYGASLALDDVGFEVGGGIFGLLGGNGAGKSTLLRAVLGLVALDQGRIEVEGLDSAREAIEVRRRVGYLPERLELYDRLTGWEHLRFMAGIRELDNGEERRRWLAELDLEEDCHAPLGAMSLGMRKKIGLVGALMGAPRLVLLDEPLNGLDTASMAWLRGTIRGMAAAGSTFVICSHVMSFVERVCARLVILRQGRLVAKGTPTELRAAAGLATEPFEDVFLRLSEEGVAADPAER